MSKEEAKPKQEAKPADAAAPKAAPAAPAKTGGVTFTEAVPATVEEIIGRTGMRGEAVRDPAPALHEVCNGRRVGGPVRVHMADVFALQTFSDVNGIGYQQQRFRQVDPGVVMVDREHALAEAQRSRRRRVPLGSGRSAGAPAGIEAPQTRTPGLSPRRCRW